MRTEKEKMTGTESNAPLPRHIAVVGALVRDKEDRVLLIRHHRRGWEIPQGKVEEGEDLLTALRREAMEEAGVEIEPLSLVYVHSKVSFPTALVFGFLARYVSGEPTPCDECPEAGWFSPGEALQMVKNPVSLERLRALLSFSGAVTYRSYTSNPFRLLSEATVAGG